MIKETLIKFGLKVTPQRYAVLGALISLKDHPTAESIIEYVRQNHPNIAVGTVYKTLETFCSKGIIRRVKTDKDYMRYDIETHSHHHIYCDECDHIENYYDEEFDVILNQHFRKKKIKNFNIKEINLQIVGSYKDHKPNKT
jgi:Fur family peroxide stress response transcriptional regulator